MEQFNNNCNKSCNSWYLMEGVLLYSIVDHTDKIGRKVRPTKKETHSLLTFVYGAEWTSEMYKRLCIIPISYFTMLLIRSVHITLKLACFTFEIDRSVHGTVRQQLQQELQQLVSYGGSAALILV